MPGQRGVDGHANDLTAQREAARNTHNQTKQNRHTALNYKSIHGLRNPGLKRFLNPTVI